VKGKPEETIKVLKEHLLDNKPLLFASVGDFVSENALNHGLIPDIIVVDNRTLRQEIKPIDIRLSKISVKNPPATITKDNT